MANEQHSRWGFFQALARLAKQKDLNAGTRISSSDVTPGSVFCKNGECGRVKTARVLSVGEDECGIPHVCFEVSLRHPSFSYMLDSRVLALSSFSRQYPNRI